MCCLLRTLRFRTAEQRPRGQRGFTSRDSVVQHSWPRCWCGLTWSATVVLCLPRRPLSPKLPPQQLNLRAGVKPTRTRPSLISRPASRERARAIHASRGRVGCVGGAAAHPAMVSEVVDVSAGAAAVWAAAATPSVGIRTVRSLGLRVERFLEGLVTPWVPCTD